MNIHKVAVLLVAVSMTASGAQARMATESRAHFNPAFDLNLNSWASDPRVETILESTPLVTQQQSDVQLVRANSDAMDGYADIVLGVDGEEGNQTVVSLSYVPDKGDRNQFSLAQLEKGVVLLNRGGHDVLKLRFVNFNASLGGTLVLTYLYNGITGSTQDFDMDLVHSGTTWFLQTMDASRPKTRFTSIYLHAHKLFGQVIGIERVTVQ